MTSARKQRSYGAVIYSPRRQRFLILKHRDGHWEFPKGTPEAGEEPDETLDREIKEETGISSYACIPFSHTSYYRFYADGLIDKEVEYSLLLSDDPITISDEHKGYRWVPYRVAQRSLKFRNHRDVLRAAATALVRSGRVIPGFSP